MTTTFASARPSPWAAVGTTITDPDAALQAAGLDWAVECVALRTADDLAGVPDFIATRRSDTGRILGVVGDDYTPFQNQDMLGFFRDLALEQNFTIETAGSFQHGRVVWIMAHLPELGIRIGDDHTKTYLFISNGHAGNKTLTVAPTTVRIICQNTMALAESQARHRRRQGLGLAGGFAIRHTPGIHAAVADIKAAYARTLAQHHLTTEIYEHLARVPLTTALERSFHATVFGLPGPDESKRAEGLRQAREQRLATIMASETSRVRGTKDSAYALFQSVVEYIDHERTTRTSSGVSEAEARLLSATAGSGAALKAKAWKAMVELTA